jgi:hypothetical protein
MVKRNNRFMGSVFMIGTGDRQQTQPIDGRPLLTSPLVIANFLELTTPVRSSGDLALQHIQEMTRLPAATWSDSVIPTKFAKLIEENCTFVEDGYDEEVPTNSVYVFSKRIPCRKAEVRVFKSNERKIFSGIHLKRSFRYRKNYDSK